jgi:hypothetical protein
VEFPQLALTVAELLIFAVLTMAMEEEFEFEIDDGLLRYKSSSL